MKTKHITSFIIVFAIALFCVLPATYSGVSQGSDTNTKNGNNALQNDTTGVDNSAYGVQALFSNTTGNDNTGIGFQSLYNNTTGGQNTAVGSQALFNNLTTQTPDANSSTTGLGTAAGYQGLFNNTTGFNDVAVGNQALFSNTIGFFDVALGDQALFSNVDGTKNCALGMAALTSLTSGDSNTAVGNATLANSGTVNFNTALGRRALFRTQGDFNLGLGFFSGSNLRDGGTNNIYVGNVGPVPIGTESNTIRIGTQIPATGTIGNPPVESHTFPQHTDTYVAGIFGSSTIAPGMPVYVDANGKLGTLPSSERFKQNVKQMSNASEEIFSLKPVTFRYKPEVTKDATPQFGLVAEDVAKVDPDLVVRDGNGKIQSVRYEAVNAMLLNEFIKEHRQVQEQQKQIEKLSAQLKEQAALIQKVSARVELKESRTQTVTNNQ